MARITVDIDLDDLMFDLSKYEKQDLVNKLYENRFIPKTIEAADARDPKTHLEYELSEILDKVWDNRSFINNEALESLKLISKKGL